MITTPARPAERDHESLLQPIRPEAPAGDSLRYDPVYDQIAAARRGEDANLSQGVWQRTMQQPDWDLVEELCYTTLQTRSKDLQLAVWLTEAWLHRYGICGFASGCQLIIDLHENYLLSMFPRPDLSATESADRVPLPLDLHNEAIEHRLNMLQWLNEKLSTKLKLLPLSAPFEHSDVLPVSLAEIQAAQYKSQVAKSSGHPAVPINSLDAGLARSLNLTPRDHLAQTWTDLHQALDIVQTLGSTLDRFYGESNGGLLQIAGVLEGMISAIATGLPPEEQLSSVQAFAPSPEPLPQTETFPNPGAITPSDPSHSPDYRRGLQNREQAYVQLADIAEFLARIEPHSPVPYLLKRAIAWGGMSLHELLPELLNDQSALKDVGHLLRLNANGNGATTKRI